MFYTHKFNATATHAFTRSSYTHSLDLHTRSCKLPDASSVHTFQCACDDNAFQINAERSADNWDSGAFWCSTVMSMLRYDGTPIYIYNPYSLATLKLKLEHPTSGQPLDQYLACVAAGTGSCEGPTDNVFIAQQVNALTHGWFYSAFRVSSPLYLPLFRLPSTALPCSYFHALQKQLQSQLKTRGGSLFCLEDEK